MTEEQKGNAIAKAVWRRLHEMEAVQLVPWVADPTSDLYDGEKVAEQRGYHRAVAEIKALITEMSQEP